MSTGKGRHMVACERAVGGEWQGAVACAAAASMTVQAKQDSLPVIHCGCSMCRPACTYQ